MTELPDKIDIQYVTKMNPASQGAAAVATVINTILDYLRERESLFDALKAFAKPIDETLDRKLGPSPGTDPDLRDL